MTKATEKPLRRLVDAGSYGSLILEVTARLALLRPPRVRRAEAAVTIPWGALYTHALLARDVQRAKRRTRR